MRTSLGLLVVGCLVSSAWSQQELRHRAARGGELRNGGVLHLATGTWTRKATGVSLGADVIYNNSCYVGYYGPLTGDTFVTQGRAPSPTSPTNLSSRPGCATSYMVDGFEIGYCTDRPDLGTYAVSFFQTYIACSSVIGVTPTASFALAGLPHGQGAGTVCWTLTIDLDAPAGAGLAFTLAADGDGSYSGGSNSNIFGWSMRCSLPWAEQVATGPTIAGDWYVCGPYDGTRWDSPVNYAEAGTGMGNLAQFRIEGGPTTPGCYFYCGTPDPTYHLRLFSDACPNQPVGATYCFGDGSGAACPCGNASSPSAQAGCLNSLGLAGRLRANGYVRLTADSVVLTADGMPSVVSVLYFQGTVRVNGGFGVVFGDGLRCAGGSVTRTALHVTSSGGAASYPGAGDPPLSVQGGVTAPGIRTYQAWYRNGASFCTTSTFNLTNGVEIAWGL